MSNIQGASGLKRIIFMAFDFVNLLVPFVISLTVLVFLFGIFKFVLSNDTKDRDSAKGYIIWGIVCLFVMVSVWGLVNILVYSFGLTNLMPAMPDVPSL